MLGKLFVIAASSLCLTACTHVAPPSSATAAAQTRAAPAKPAIWKIEDEDSELWIFGSFHVLPSDLEWRPEELDTALESVDTIWFETDLSPEGFAETGAALAAAGRGKGKLLSRLPDDVAAQLKALAQGTGFPVAILDASTVWSAALTAVQLVSTKNGEDPTSGVELTLARDAVQRGIPIRGLESTEQHIGLFTGLSENAQLAMLAGALESPPSLMSDMRLAWMGQDFVALERYGDRSFGDTHPELGERMIVARNVAWVDAISQRLAGEGRDLVVVGAIHTVGEDGIITLLRERGFNVSGPTIP